MKQNHITVFVFGTHPVSVAPKAAARRKAKYPVDNNPVVQFMYPKSQEPWVRKLRTVKLIGADSRYFIGLEVSEYKTPSGVIKPRHQFKKFLRSKVTGFDLVTFAPETIS